MGNSHEFHNMSLFLWQWGVNCAVLPHTAKPLNITFIIVSMLFTLSDF